MKLNKTTWALIIGATILIISNLATCSLARRNCPTVEIKTVTVERWTTDTLQVTTPGATEYTKGKDVIIIKSDKQKDSLLIEQARKIANTEKLLDYYKGQLEAFEQAGVGETITSEPPQVEKSGEKFNKDSTIIVKWRVTVEGDMPNGTPTNPNPYFEIEALQKETTNNVDASKPYALGAGIGAKLNLDGTGLDVVPQLHFRNEKTVWFGRYHIKSRSVEFGGALEGQLGRRKK